MAKIASTRKVFNFRVEIAGLDQWEIQKATPSEPEIEAVKHGDTNHDIKTPGRVSFTDLILEKLRPMNGSDNWAWLWLLEAQNPLTGGGSLPIKVNQIIILKEMDNTGFLTLNRWVHEGCWVRKVSQSAFDRNSSDNIIETATLSVNRAFRL